MCIRPVSLFEHSVLSYPYAYPAWTTFSLAYNVVCFYALVYTRVLVFVHVLACLHVLFQVHAFAYIRILII